MITIININKDKNLVIGVIGFGEVGQEFVNAMVENKANVFVYDLLLEQQNNPLKNKIENIGAHPVASINEIGRQCHVIFSLVNSAASEAVATEIAHSLRKSTVFLDMATSTPQVKLKNEQIITNYGGIYVDVAIMGSIAAEKTKVPLLVAGEWATEVKSLLGKLGFNGITISHPNGGAASIKLLRSIFMKGLEALILETMITAEKYEVLDDVMESISTTLNNNDFSQFANTLITTHVIHKQRRYKEVMDSCSIIEEANIDPHVTKGVLSFFSKSVDFNIDEKIIGSKDVTKILQEYSNQNKK